MSNWYQVSREAIQRVYGQDWRLFCGLLAATSPHAHIKGNTTLAKRAYNEIKLTGTVKREHFCLTHYRGILAILTSGQPNGRKCQAFYRNLIGLEDSVPVDIWMMRKWGLDKQTPTRVEYDRIEHDVKSRAFYNFNTPAQEQAAIWGSIRGDAGSYANELNQYRLF